MSSTENNSFNIALAGVPNCGKTTIFNALTNKNRLVGNWSGVTVDKVSGYTVFDDNLEMEVIDLPGSNSLLPIHATTQEEQVARNYISDSHNTLIVNVVDSLNLERNLTLTAQLSLLNKPFIIVCNMIDIAYSQDIKIDKDKLSKELGVPVICVSAVNSASIVELKKLIQNSVKALANNAFIPKKNDIFVKNKEIINDISQLNLGINEHPVFLISSPKLNNEQHKLVQTKIDKFCQKNSIDNIIASISGEIISYTRKVASNCLTYMNSKNNIFTEKMDRIVLNKWLGIPIFLSIMYIIFVLTMGLGNGVLVDVFDIFARVVFVDFPRWLLGNLGVSEKIILLLSEGIGGSIEIIFSFIPVIFLMFFFMAILENSGYMTRAAFILDRFLTKFDLSGHVFLPLILGFGCNVPAINGAKVLSSRADRYATMIMAPFMSCSARLPVYAFFCSAFFVEHSATIVFSLYLVGIFMALLTGIIVRKTILRYNSSPLILEMPIYHRPHFKTIWRISFLHTTSFIHRIKNIIIPLVTLVTILNLFSFSGGYVTNSKDSALATIGKKVSFIFTPIGVEKGNWQATVGLLTGIVAKEAVVGTMTSLYSEQDAEQQQKYSWKPQFLRDGVVEIYSTARDDLKNLASVIVNPSSLGNAQIIEDDNSRIAVSKLRGSFKDRLSAYSFLLFILLYIPCIMTIVAIKRQGGTLWTVISAFWSFTIAYFSAAIFNMFSHLRYYDLNYIILMFLVLSILLSLQIVTMQRLSQSFK